MFRLKMGFTKVLAAAATRGTPLAAILLNKPPPHPIPFQPASAALFSLAKTERHAPKPCGWARAAGAECACSAAQTQARALCVLPVTAPPGGARAPGWPLAACRWPPAAGPRAGAAGAGQWSRRLGSGVLPAGWPRSSGGSALWRAGRAALPLSASGAGTAGRKVTAAAGNGAWGTVALTWPLCGFPAPLLPL